MNANTAVTKITNVARNQITVVSTLTTTEAHGRTRTTTTETETVLIGITGAEVSSAWLTNLVYQSASETVCSDLVPTNEQISYHMRDTTRFPRSPVKFHFAIQFFVYGIGVDVVDIELYDTTFSASLNTHVHTHQIILVPARAPASPALVSEAPKEAEAKEEEDKAESKKRKFVQEEEDQEDKECKVCYDDDKSLHSLHKCGHRFCESCITTISNSKHPLCPLCRLRITGYSDVFLC